MKTNLNKIDYCSRNHSHLVYRTKQRCAGKHHTCSLPTLQAARTQCPIPTAVLFQNAPGRAGVRFPQLCYSKGREHGIGQATVRDPPRRWCVLRRHHTVNYYENEQIGVQAPPHCGREKARTVQPSDAESFPAEQGLALLVATTAKLQGAAANKRLATGAATLTSPSSKPQPPPSPSPPSPLPPAVAPEGEGRRRRLFFGAETRSPASWT